MDWGIDGCKNGWIAIGLDEDTVAFDVYDSIQAFWDANHDCRRVLIDMPIGLTNNTPRQVEGLARQKLVARRSSIFPTPSRDALALGAERKFTKKAREEASDLNHQRIGVKLNVFSWAIMPKIHEVDQFLRQTPTARDKMLEAHPEILFWAFNGGIPARYPKKEGLGFIERVQLLEAHQPNALDIIRDVYDAHAKRLVDDDIVDALACAIAARFDTLLSLPPSPSYDQFGLPMQMVFPKM